MLDKVCLSKLLYPADRDSYYICGFFRRVTVFIVVLVIHTSQTLALAQYYVNQ